jgi:hypothetical protein
MFRGVLVLLIIVGLPSIASADDVGYKGWGPRLGLTINPDQFHVGAHMDFGQFAKHIRIQPNVELGFGDGGTTLAINGEGAYRFSSNWDAWSPYAGGGMGINTYFSHGQSDLDLGLNLLAGVEKGMANGNRFFLEFKLGLFDSPDAKFTAGWSFY